MLEERLKYLNGSLDGIFEQLLKRIHPVHQTSAASYVIFEQIWSSSHHRYAWRGLSVLDVAFACVPDLSEELHALLSMESRCSIKQETVNKCVRRLNSFQTHLSSRCAGLLDVYTTSDTLHPRGLSYPSPIKGPMAETGIAHHCYTLKVCFTSFIPILAYTPRRDSAHCAVLII